MEEWGIDENDLKKDSVFVMQRALTEIRKEGKITKENLTIVNRLLRYSEGEPAKKIQSSRDFHFSLLAREYEQLNGVPEVPDYDLSASIDLSDITLSELKYPSQTLFRHPRRGLPWLKLWFNMIQEVDKGLKAALDIQAYRDYLREREAVHAKDLSSVFPDMEEVEETVASFDKYEGLRYQDEPAFPFLLKVAAYAKKANFNFLDEGQKAIDARKREVDAQTRKRILWEEILGLFQLKLNKQ